MRPLRWVRKCWWFLRGVYAVSAAGVHANAEVSAIKARFRERARAWHGERHKLLRENAALVEDVDMLTHQKNVLAAKLEIAKVEIEGVAACHESLLQMQLAQTAVAVRQRTDAEQTPMVAVDAED